MNLKIWSFNCSTLGACQGTYISIFSQLCIFDEGSPNWQCLFTSVSLSNALRQGARIVFLIFEYLVLSTLLDTMCLLYWWLQMAPFFIFHNVFGNIYNDNFYFYFTFLTEQRISLLYGLRWCVENCHRLFLKRFYLFHYFH